MTELSLNEAESLAARAARGAGFSWGLADDVGRAARGLAREGADWGASLLALLEQAPGLAAPGAGDAKAPLCPVRMAAWLNDAPPDKDALVLRSVAAPVWLDALLRAHGVWRAEAGAQGEVTVLRGAVAPKAVARRAEIAPAAFAALSAYAARLYVPESERSRARGAGGGSVDDE